MVRSNKNKRFSGKNAVLLLLAACVAASVLLLPGSGFGVPKKDDDAAREYSHSRSDYQRLIKTDPRAGNLAAWEKVASELLNFVRNYDDAEYTPQALFTLGNLYETTYQQRRFRSGLTKAIYFYEELAKGYRAHPLADDALLRIGDLRRNFLKDEEGARAAYYQIIDSYPKGDKHKEAAKRLGLKVKEEGDGEKPEVRSEKETETGTEAETEMKGDQPGPQAVAETPLPAAKEKVDVAEGGREIYSRESEIKRPVIAIDPGHGGKEEGAKGVDGVLEKEVVMNISQMLDQLLRDRLRAKTVLTRTRDLDLPLQERTAIANQHGADLFISIHANASEYKNVTGIETYYLDNTDDKSSLKLAERENAPAMKQSANDLGFMVSDLIQDAKVPDSVALAHHIQNALYRNLSRYYKGVKDLGVKKAPFYVLVGAHMPCVLVEVSFIDNPIEGRRLISRRYQKLVASAIYEGMRAFFESR
jgi:N-acetylmuramoyl-L-alanine amidase